MMWRRRKQATRETAERLEAAMRTCSSASERALEAAFDFEFAVLVFDHFARDDGEAG